MQQVGSSEKKYGPSAARQSYYTRASRVIRGSRLGKLLAAGSKIWRGQVGQVHVEWRDKPMRNLRTASSDIAASSAAEKIEALQDSISRVIRGKAEAVRLSIVTLLAGGHLLIEDVPGVGKTTLAHAMARALDCSFQRIQF